MNSELSRLNKIANPITGGTKQVTVGELKRILDQVPDSAKVFVFDTFEECDVPVTESDIFCNPENTELYIDLT